MHFAYNNSKRQRWRQIWPTSFLAIIAVSQMLLTFTIIGFETWSMILNIHYAFLFIGFITSFFFTVTWISTFTVVCCNRESQGCATHALVENILSIIASSVLLYYDVQFLRYPYTCFWPGDICDDSYLNVGWSVGWNSYDFDFQGSKTIAVKGQLACAAVMLATSVAFMFVYIYTSLKVKSKSSIISPRPAIELMQTQPPPPIPIWATQSPDWPPPSNY